MVYQFRKTARLEKRKNDYSGHSSPKAERKLLELERESSFSEMALLQGELAGSKGKNALTSVAKEREYFIALRESQYISKRIRSLTSKIIELNNKPRKISIADEIEERRAIKEANVTSLAYERSRRACFYVLVTQNVD